MMKMKQILLLAITSIIPHTHLATGYSTTIVQQNGNATVTINGKTLFFANAQTVSVMDGRIYVNGKEMYDEAKAIQQLKTNLKEDNAEVPANRCSPRLGQSSRLCFD